MSKVIVTVNEGRVRGIRRKSEYSGAEYYAFFGIPYGQSTAGAARFKDPVKAQPWNNILDATTEKEGCLQFSVHTTSIYGTEDCLFNNVYTPELPAEGDPPKPVIVLLHGGGYMTDSPATNQGGSPEYVMHRDIVYVCVSFRLHILGFLNLKLKDCSGNQALKDVILSLQWIRDNIQVFGGDPNNITMIGSSSGSGMIHHLMVMPQAKGLFHKAVPMGTYIYNPTFPTTFDHTEIASHIANLLGHKTDEKNNVRRLLSFLKKADTREIISMRYELMLAKSCARLLPQSVFSPTGEDAQSKTYKTSTARIPVMFGICEREAALGFMKQFKRKTMEHFYTSYRQNCYAWGYDVTDDEVEEIKQKIDSFYLKGASLYDVPLSLKVDIQTDIACSDVYETFINVIAADLPSSVFLYKFEYECNDIPSVKDFTKPLLDEPLRGTFHAEELSFWACMTYRGGKTGHHPGARTRQVIELFTKLITNFARTGNPNFEGLGVEWRPTTPEKPCYLSINTTPKMVDGKLNGERMEFWEEIVRKIRQKRASQ